MNKTKFIDRRTKIISDMLDNPDELGIYPTTICFAELDDLFDDILVTHGLQPYEPSEAQILRREMKIPRNER